MPPSRMVTSKVPKPTRRVVLMLMANGNAICLACIFILMAGHFSFLVLTTAVSSISILQYASGCFPEKRSGCHANFACRSWRERGDLNEEISLFRNSTRRQFSAASLRVRIDGEIDRWLAFAQLPAGWSNIARGDHQPSWIPEPEHAKRAFPLLPSGTRQGWLYCRRTEPPTLGRRALQPRAGFRRRRRAERAFNR